MPDGKALQAPFPAKDVEWRVSHEVKQGASALVLAYLTARAVQQRLDDVAGCDGWAVEYKPGPCGGISARLGIRCSADYVDSWVWKEDGAENTDVEAIKGGYSAAFKRAAVVWGIGRYLYDLGDSYVTLGSSGEHYHKRKDGSAAYWNAPALPKWALPEGERPKPTAAKPKPEPAALDAAPTAKHAAMVSAFAAFGVSQHDIDAWLGHPLESSGDFEVSALRDIYSRIKTGKSSWAAETAGKVA